jgi:hypothetical protein
VTRSTGLRERCWGCSSVEILRKKECKGQALCIVPEFVAKCFLLVVIAFNTIILYRYKIHTYTIY